MEKNREHEMDIKLLLRVEFSGKRVYTTRGDTGAI